MATDPIPEPFTNQEVEAEKQPKFPSVAPSPPVEPVPTVEVPRSISEASRGVSTESKLHQSARRAGAALGEAVNSARDLSQRSTRTNAEFSRVAREMTENFKDESAKTAADLSEEVKMALDKGRRKVRANYRNARYAASEAYRRGYDQFRQISHEKPMQLIAICAGAGFVLGVFLRIWRSSGYE